MSDIILLAVFIAGTSIAAEDAVKPWPAPVTSWPDPDKEAPGNLVTV